jgi:hypothetical protein
MHTPSVEGYQTTNAALATLLVTLGVPFLKNSAGEDVRVINIYTVTTLRKLGFGGQGLSLEEGAELAFSKGRHGDLTYVFEKTPLLEKITEAWEATDIEIKRLDSEGKKASSIATINSEPEEVAALACLLQKHRAMVTKMWQHETPCILDSDSSREPGVKEGSSVIVGSFKLISLNASKETRARVGL